MMPLLPTVSDALFHIEGIWLTREWSMKETVLAVHYWKWDLLREKNLDSESLFQTIKCIQY